MNAHQILNVAANATPAQIKAAYRTLRSLNHPDRNPLATATEAMAAINRAFDYMTKGGRWLNGFDAVRIIRTKEELAAALAPKEEPKAKATRAPRAKKGLKALLMERFERGEVVYESDYPDVKVSTFKTAVSDLRSAKYCGRAAGPLNIKRFGTAYQVQ